MGYNAWITDRMIIINSCGIRTAGTYKKYGRAKKKINRSEKYLQEDEIMNKTLAMIFAATMVLGTTVMAEETDKPAGREINCQIEDGSYVIQIPVEEGDLGWKADDMGQDDSIVVLGSEEIADGNYTVRYDAVSDGEMTVAVRHYYNAFAIDQVITWDLVVRDGAVAEVKGGSETKLDPEEDQKNLDSYLSGEWTEAETQFSTMTVTGNNELGWDVEIVSPLTHGAYVFKTTVYRDCEKDLVYDKGKYWDVPITDGENDAPLGEAKIAGTTGSFTFEEDENNENNLKLVWYDDQRPEETIVFERTNEEKDVSADTADWKYYTFEGSDVAMKIPADFASVGEPGPGVTYNCRNNDVLLQVQIMDGDFTDRDALMEYLNNQEYIIRATQIEINNVELVYAQGGDDDAQVYAVISPEGTTYEFVFIPQNENGADVIQAITQTICHSGEIPEE